jgi:5-methylcytosine-specific restriction endonuclease McrA
MQSPIELLRLCQKQPRLKLDPEEYTLLRTSVLERDGWRCQECGYMEGFEVHHIKPRSRLGDDVFDNALRWLSREVSRRTSVNAKPATRTRGGS